MILGKWVSNYKSLDKVIFLDTNYIIRKGYIYFEQYFTENYIIFCNKIPYTSIDILVLANVEDNSYYNEHPQELIKSYVESLQLKLKQAECNHNWIEKSKTKRCSLCYKQI